MKKDTSQKETNAVNFVVDQMFALMNDKAYSRVLKAAKRRHLTVNEYLRRTASNILLHGTTRRYYYCSQD